MPIAAATALLPFLRGLIAIPSLTGEEAEAADYVAAHVQRAGLDIWRQDDNVSFALGDGEDVLLLNTHLDVVPPSSDHPYDPYDPVVTDGVLYGRGSVDAKASGAAMTTALLSLMDDGWAPPAHGQVRVALTTFEEGGGLRNGLQNVRPNLPEVSAAIIGEPTGLAPCIAQKGLLILKIHAHGTSSHAGRPHLGENAISRAMQALQKIKAITLDRDDPHVGTPSISPTTIEGGTARNIIPEHCVVALDIRTTPAYTHDEIIATVQDAVASVPGIEVEVYSNRFFPCGTPSDSRIQQACEAASGAAPIGSPTASDWIFVRDVPAVKMGPGDSSRSHTGGERIPVAEVERAVAVYRRVIQSYFAA